MIPTIIDEVRKIRDKWIKGDGIIGNCHEICIEVNKILKSLGIKGVIVVGEIGNNPFWTTKHYWIVVRGKYLGMDGGLVIIDPTIDQFSSEHAMNGIVDVDLGVGLPDVGIFTERDKERKFYNP